MDIRTILARAGLCSDTKSGAISTPIYQTATFRHEAVGHSTGYDYSLTQNPTRGAISFKKTGSSVQLRDSIILTPYRDLVDSHIRIPPSPNKKNKKISVYFLNLI